MQVFLAPGASGTVETMRPYLDGLTRRGISAHGVSLPRGKAEGAVATYRTAVAAAGIPLAEAVIGGQSFGGRVASLIAAEEPVAGLVLLCYPLHRPGHPDDLRAGHWPQIHCPTLLLSGESDPLARIDLLRREVGQLADARLFTFAGVGHGLGPVIEAAIDRLVEFVSQLRAPPRDA